MGGGVSSLSACECSPSKRSAVAALTGSVGGSGASCPFCKRANYSAEYLGPLSALEQRRAQEEEQKVIKLQIEQQVRS